MSAATLTPTPVPEGIPAKARVTFGHLLRAEWIKLWSLRSTTWTLAITAVVLVGFVLLISLAMTSPMSDGEELNALDAFGATVYLGPLAVVVLGALSITGEYSTGMIRSSLAAAPRRLPVLWSKALVLTAVVLSTSLASIAAAAGLQQLLFSGQGLELDLGDPQVLRALAGNAVFVTAIAVLAFGVGAIMRVSAAAITTVLGVLLVVPILFQLIPWKPLESVLPFLPNVAGGMITMTDAMIESQHEFMAGADLSAWEGLAVLCGYVAVSLAVAAVLLKRRDA